MKRIVCLLALFCVSFANAQENQLTSKEKRGGWELLFNGENLEGWTSVGKSEPPKAGWVVSDGVLTILRKSDRKSGGGGDIITRKKYSDFDLRLEFRLTEAANSGVKYLFTKYEKGGWLGLEFQVLDDVNHPDAKNGRDGNRKTGCLYDMYPIKKKEMRAIGEWNEARIVVKGDKVSHYLNGKKILSFDRGSEDYEKTWKMSKFKNSVPMFGDVEEGYILLQDHSDEVSYRNVKIKELD